MAKDGVHRPQRAKVAAPAAPGKEDTEKDGSEGDDQDNPAGEVRIVVGVPDDLDPEHHNAEDGHDPAGIILDELRRLPGWLDQVLKEGAGNGKGTDTAPRSCQKKEREEHQRPADVPPEGQAKIRFRVGRTEKEEQHGDEQVRNR